MIKIKNLDKIKEILSKNNLSEKDINKILNEINSSEKYGLIFEEKEFEKIDLNKIIFTEKEKIISDENKRNNLLFQGENLLFLNYAQTEYINENNNGMIDICYIDPPYFTNNKAMKYNDSFIKKDNKYKHSYWLSYMKERLLLLKNILKEHGVFMCSINDKEYPHLRLLCDDIFGENNYLGTFIQNKCNAQNDAKNIQSNHEYILCYCKNKKYKDKKEVELLYIKEFEKQEVIKENDKYYYLGSNITTGGHGGVLNARQNLGWSIYYNPKTKDKIGLQDYDLEKAKTSNIESEVYTDNQELLKKGYVIIRPPKKHNLLGAWTWSLEKFNKEKDNIYVNETSLTTRKKIYVKNEDVFCENDKYYINKEIKKASKSIIEFPTAQGTKMLIDIIKNKNFNNPKNSEMMKYLISLMQDKNIVVLDFFAGSGTTAQAVMELNKEDNGNRQFILCTNNENNICENSTFPRLKTLITGERIDGSKYKETFNENLIYKIIEEKGEDKND